MNIVSLLFNNVKNSPNKVAVISKGEKIRYSQFWQNVQVILGNLKSMGFKKGDKIALFLPNSTEHVYCFYAILMGGGIVIPLAPYLRQFEIKAMLGNSKPSLVITQLELWKKATLSYQFNAKVISITQITSKLNMVRNENIESLKSDSVASINYTYNGTGYPKGAKLTHANFLYALYGLVRHLGLRKGDIFLAPHSMAHIYSLTLGNLVPLLSGATMIITDSYFPSTILDLIEKHNATILISVPSLFNLLNRELMRKKHQIQSLRFMISGGEYMPPELQTSIVKEFKVPIVQGYGLTECMPIICNVPNGPNKPESIGLPGRKDISIKIVDSSMKEVEIGEIGEILIKSPTIMSGYYNSPKDTLNAFYDGWLKTGDFGSVDYGGFLYFNGLKKKIYNLSGLKVDPVELELVGKSHLEVKDVKISQKTIHGILPKKILIAEVFLNKKAESEEKDLEEFYRTQIAWYKVPKHMIIRK